MSRKIVFAVIVVFGVLAIFGGRNFRAWQVERRLMKPVAEYNSQPNFTNLMEPWDSAAAILPRYAADSVLGGLVMSVLKELPKDREFVESTLTHASGLEVDYLGMAHPTNAGPAEEEIVQQSQKVVGKLLGKLDPTVVVIEGSPCENFDQNCLREQIEDELGPGLKPPGFVDMAIAQTLLDYASMRYGLEHAGHDLFVVGGETRALHALHAATLHQDRSDPEFSNLLLTLSMLRTDMALARAIRVLRAGDDHHVVVPYGLAHAREFSRLFQKIGTRSKIYVTVN